jgi:predicted metal-binding protein
MTLCREYMDIAKRNEETICKRLTSVLSYKKNESEGTQRFQIIVKVVIYRSAS